MQVFIDTKDDSIHEFEDDVKVQRKKDGVYEFIMRGEVVLKTPTTLVPHNAPEQLALSRAQESCNHQAISVINEKIRLGFISDALGEPHLYPMQAEDQTNLLSAALASKSQDASWSVLLPCKDETNLWGHLAHSASQVQQVLSKWVSHKQECSTKLREYKQLISEAKTPEDAGAIIELLDKERTQTNATVEIKPD